MLVSEGQQQPVLALDFKPDGSAVAAGGEFNDIKLLAAAGGAVRTRAAEALQANTRRDHLVHEMIYWPLRSKSPHSLFSPSSDRQRHQVQRDQHPLPGL